MDDEDDLDSAAHQQELEAQRWQEELTADPGYFQWLLTLAAEAALRTEKKDGDYSF